MNATSKVAAGPTEPDSRPASTAGPSQPSSWRLSHQLKGHTSDVKAVHCTLLHSRDGMQTREAIVSVSRDSTAKVWTRPVGVTEQAGWVEGPTFDGGGRYLNAVVVVPPRDDKEDATLLIAGLDAQIRVYPLPFTSLTTSPPTHYSEPSQIIQEHYSNITSLRHSSSSGDLLLSSSWDATARSYRRDVKGRWHRLHLLKGQESAVWGIEIVDAREGEEKYLTASADLFVRMFEGEECKVVWEGHRDVVRDLRLLGRGAQGTGEEDGEQLFASSSNDPPIHLNSLSPHRRPPGIPTKGGPPILKLEGHTSIVYSLALLPPQISSSAAAGQSEGKEQQQEGGELLLVSSSEDGTVRLWNPRPHLDVPFSSSSSSSPADSEESRPRSRLVATIPHPITTIWSVDVLPSTRDIASGGEDGVVRVFTQKEEDKEELGVTKEEREGFERGCEEVARRTGRLGARGQLIAIDLPTSSSTSASTPATAATPSTGEPGNKQTHPLTNQLYDHLLPIDISDTQPLLMLGVNHGDDPRQVAKEFIATHELPESYEEEIVAFIEQVVG